MLLSAGAARADAPLSLADCVAIVLDKSPQVIVAESGLQQRQDELRATRKSLLPALSYQYTYADQTDSALSDHTYSSTFSVEQPLYRGRALVTGVALGELAVSDAELAASKARDALVLQVHDAYYGLLSTQRLEQETTQALERLQAHRRDARAFFDAGLIPKNDLLQSEVQEAQGEQDLLAAQNRTSMSRARLNLLLRRPVEEAVTVLDALVYKPRPVVAWEALLRKALDNRPEISRQRLATQQAEERIILARADHLPSVTLSASYQKNGGDYFAAPPYAGASEVKTAQAVASWKFWTWHQGADKVAAARQQVRQSKEGEAQAADGVTLEVREAYLNLMEAEKNIAVTEKAIRSAEENYRISEARYQAQVTTSTEVLDAQTLLTRARTNYFVALHKYNMALATLDWATGTIIPKQDNAS
ncbi:MAG: TolC family protein [Desulfobulbaceae bacterium]|nr:TolC family protein [Desulfobulbaceae bacterium]